MNPTFYCPTCDTPLDVTEYAATAERSIYYGEDGNDVYLKCFCCGWYASAVAQRTMCEAWDHALGELKKATVLIVEPDGGLE